MFGKNTQNIATLSDTTSIRFVVTHIRSESTFEADRSKCTRIFFRLKKRNQPIHSSHSVCAQSVSKEKRNFKSVCAPFANLWSLVFNAKITKTRRSSVFVWILFAKVNSEENWIVIIVGRNRKGEISTRSSWRIDESHKGFASEHFRRLMKHQSGEKQMQDDNSQWNFTKTKQNEFSLHGNNKNFP